MKLMKSVFLLLLVLLVAACKKETHYLNEEFTLDFNEKAFILVDGKKHEIAFVKLIEDSRCGPDEQCFWQGQVAVKVLIDNKTEIIIGHHTTIPSSAEFEGHFVGLRKVSYDKKKNYRNENHCSLRIKVY